MANLKRENKESTEKNLDKPRNISTFTRYIVNFCTAATVGLFVYWALFFIPNYDFLPKKIIGENLHYIAKNDTLDLSARTAAKLGWSSYFFDKIKNSVPDDAVVLLPPQEVVSAFNKGKRSGKSQINYYKNPAWVNYYLYPVRYVYADDKVSPLLTQVTHVAVFNRWGFNRLSYKPKEHLHFDVLPIQPF